MTAIAEFCPSSLPPAAGAPRPAIVSSATTTPTLLHATYKN